LASCSALLACASGIDMERIRVLLMSIVVIVIIVNNKY
jgi:hypothetical protein